MVRWHNSESTVKPLSVDETLSKIVVYLRRNIQEEVRTDDQGNETTWYVYEEAEVDKTDYYAISACTLDMREQTEANVQDIEDTRTGLMETYEETTANSNDIAEVRAGLMEVYEMLEGGN